MPDNRLLRYTLAGGSFLLFSLFFYFAYGGNIKYIFDQSENYESLKIILLIFSSPLLGIIISTIVFEFRVKCFGYETYYFIPTDLRIIQWILTDTGSSTKSEAELRSELTNEKWSTKKFKRLFYPYYQIKVRKHICDESLKFLERKWSVIWVHRNIQGAIIFSFLVISFLRALNCYFCLNYFSSPLKNLLELKILGITLIVLYLISAYFHTNYSKVIAKEFEHKLLLNALENEERNRVELRNSERERNLSLWSLIKKVFK